jgi:uncharacterized protein YjbJ (UPF0337 family)
MKMSMAMRLRLLHRFASFLAVAALGFIALMPLPAMAMSSDHRTIPIALATMANKTDAKAKAVEGKLESAAGALTGDTGKQIKGNAKQVQASAMNAGENMKDGAKSVAKKIGNAADNIANDKS